MRLRRFVADTLMLRLGLRHLHATKVQRAIRGLLDEIDLQALRDAHACPAAPDRPRMFELVHATLPPGSAIDYLEFGVFQGESIRQWSEMNRHSESRFFGFDSFEGLPESWRDTQQKGHFSTEGLLPRIDDPRVSFIKGWFDRTVPPFACSFQARHRVVLHCDADLYGSTMIPLVLLNRFLAPGSILMFDEFYDREHEFKAFRDWQRTFRVQCRPLCQVGRFAKVAFEIL